MSKDKDYYNKPLETHTYDSVKEQIEPFVFMFDRTVDKIPESVRNWEAQGFRHEWQALGQFKKDWYEMPHKREEMLKNPITGEHDDPDLAYIAAMIHMLCVDTDHPVPEWVHKFVSKTRVIALRPVERWTAYLDAHPEELSRFHPVGYLHNVVLERPSHFLRKPTGTQGTRS